MKTVPTIVASSSAVAASALGLVFARQDSGHGPSSPAQHHHPRAPSRRTHSAPLLDMTAAATCTLSPIDVLPTPHSFTFTAAAPYSPDLRPLSRSTANDSRAQSPSYAEHELGVSKRSLKRSLARRSGTPMSMDSATQDAEDLPPTQGNWLKRLSAFSSNDGSIMSSNRPHSVAISQSNGSVAFSNAGSTTPIFPSFSPAPVPPNKLVKRSSSVRSTRVNSRIPIPTFKKPATSHERDANIQDLQRRPSTATSALPLDLSAEHTADPTMKSFFAPKISFDAFNGMSRRSSTAIPNPIRRVVPDRRYQPVLVSAREHVRAASIDIERPSLDHHEQPRGSLVRRTSRRIFSSPLPQRPGTASTNTSASVSRLSKTEDLKRNFSFSKRDSVHFQGQPDLNAAPARSYSPVEHPPAPLPKWKRPTKLRGPDSKNPYRNGRAASLTTPAVMTPEEPPTKRRDISGPVRTAPTQSQIPSGNELPDLTQRPQSRVVIQDTPRGIEVGQEVEKLESPPIDSRNTVHRYQSGTHSEFTSSFGGSDSDARYMDDDGFDSPNDTMFDSVRTRATSAGSTGFKGPRIDAIFDKSSEKAGVAVADSSYHSPNFLKDAFGRPRHSIIEEEENIPTPVRSYRNGSVRQSPHFDGNATSPTLHFPSSPPTVPRILRRKPSFERADKQDDWDFGDDDDHISTSSPSSKFPAFDFDTTSDLTFGEQRSSMCASPYRTQGSNDPRSNIFDWAEQQPVEKSPPGSSPPRPRTVHGKKDADNRGSRSAGRRAPSGFHARSQSVPVVPELDGKRSTVVTNKFGTWGVGSKGVTEDWNEDFDFEEPVPVISQTHTPTAAHRHASEGMQVPKSIQEQQINVLANIGLLRDWGLLIEELKDLRGRAQVLNLRDQPDSAIWHEVDAMIDLADQESNDRTLAPRQSPPSSPTFDDSAFDDPAMLVQMRNSPRVIPRVRAEDLFDSPHSSPARKLPGTPEINTPRRPRKDSEAVARSVIEALQQRRNISDPTGSSPGKSNRKVPFDTSTLRRIVPYVQELRDKVKRSIREAEGLHDSPTLEDSADTSMSMFTELPESPTARKTTRKSITRDERVESTGSLSRSPPEDLSRRMELMTMG